MFEQFTPPEQPLLQKLSQRFQLIGLAIFLLTSPALIREASGLPDRIRGLLVGVALGLNIAALTLHFAWRRQNKRRETATSAG